MQLLKYSYLGELFYFILLLLSVLILEMLMKDV